VELSQPMGAEGRDRSRMANPMRDVTRRCGTEITWDNDLGALSSQAARTAEARGGRRRCNVRPWLGAGFQPGRVRSAETPRTPR